MTNAKEDIRGDIAVMRRAAEKADAEVSQAELEKQRQVSYYWTKNWLQRLWKWVKVPMELDSILIKLTAYIRVHTTIRVIALLPVKDDHAKSP